MNILLIISVIIIVEYIAVTWWIDATLKKHIPEKEARKKYKNKNDIRESKKNLLAPVGLITGVFVLLDQNSPNLWEVTAIIIFILKLITIIFAVLLAYESYRLLKLKFSAITSSSPGLDEDSKQN